MSDTWNGWASWSEQPEGHWRHFHENRRYVEAMGGEPERVVARRDPEGRYWGWIDRDHDGPVMVQAHASLFRMQFPYNPEAEVQSGRGEVVKLSIEAAT